MKQWLWVVPLLFLAVSCGPTTQSGVNKEYRVDITVRENSTATFIMGVEADTAAEALAGDAPASATAEVPVSLAFKGAQASASGDESTIEGSKATNIEPVTVDESTESTPAPAPVVEDVVVPPDVSGETPTDPDPIDTGEPDLSLYDVLEQADCDKEMSFRDNEESTGTIQKKCIFSKPGPEYGKSFLVQWASGSILEVVDSGRMNWLIKNENGEKDYRKYHPNEPVGDGTMSYKPGTPAEVYAPRGDSSSYAMILGKKSNTGAVSDRPGYKYFKAVQWEGNPNPDIANKKFSRCWWTDTTGDFAWLQRKFNFTKDKPGTPALVVFEGGPEVEITNVGTRHYPGAPGHVKWGVPKLDDGNPCKHYYSIAAPKDSTPDYAILYYN